MNRNTRAILLLAAATPMLAGCSSFLSKLGLVGAGGPAATERVANQALVNPDLELGRQALSEGRYAAAIAAFRFARMDAAVAADAANGLGVAYAALGREDLAERYFREAIALAPQDPRFAANLLRFHRARDARFAAVVPVQPVPQPVRGPVRVEAGGGARTVSVGQGSQRVPVRVSQVSSGRVRVDWGRPEWTVVAAPVVVGASAQSPLPQSLSSQAGPVVRLSFREATAGR